MKFILFLFLSATSLFAHERTAMFCSGKSMLPTLPEHTRVVVVASPFADLKVDPEKGDIVVTRYRGMMICHRAVGRNEDGAIITQGDNNRTVDPFPTSALNYVGVIVAYEKPGAVGEAVKPAARSPRDPRTQEHGYSNAGQEDPRKRKPLAW